MARHAPCAETAQQCVYTGRVHSRPTLPFMRNTDGESNAERDADTDCHWRCGC